MSKRLVFTFACVIVIGCGGGGSATSSKGGTSVANDSPGEDEAVAGEGNIDASTPTQGRGIAESDGAVAVSHGEAGSMPTLDDADDEGTQSPPLADAGSGSQIDGATSALCCAAHETPGCADIDVQKCVCEGDERCCQDEWDRVCVELVEALGCGTCKHDCCGEHSAPGCREEAIESCVCEVDSTCCSNAWDSLCVDLVQTRDCGSCLSPAVFGRRGTSYRPSRPSSGSRD